MHSSDESDAHFRKPKQKHKYPDFRKESVSSKYGNVKVEDPYRWLEDITSPETQDFICAQNRISSPFLENYANRKQLKKVIKALVNYPKFSCPFRCGNIYFYSMNNGMQNHSVIYKLQTLESRPKVLLDPNTLSTDGSISVSMGKFSRNGEYFAFGLSTKGSDWIQIKIMMVETKKLLQETLQRVKFSGIAWTKNNEGFFYSKYPKEASRSGGIHTGKLRNHTLYYHSLGQRQENDQLAIEFPDNPFWTVTGTVTDCGKYLLISASSGCNENTLHIAKLGETYRNMKTTAIIRDFNGTYQYVTNTKSELVIFTNRNAPHFCLIKIKFNNLNERNWEHLVEEDPDRILLSAICVDSDKLILHYMKNVTSELEIRWLDTGVLLSRIPAPVGSITAISGDRKYSDVFFSVTSFLNPGTIYRLHMSENSRPKLQVWQQMEVDGFNPEKYTHIMKFYRSYDGTSVPIQIVQRKRAKRSKVPCLLYGYGGFGVSLTPSFNISAIAFLVAFDGVYAVANIRGGGEFGQEWHNQGRLNNKQNSFDDFQAAAEFLIDEGYTDHKRLSIMGGSNGGLLIAACINQQPSLYRSAIISVGVLDMMRFPLFTIGGAWISEYGDPNNSSSFKYISKYSPLHNIHVPVGMKTRYPATLVLTGTQDDRVSPMHSFKFTATLQELAGSSKYQKYPLLLKVYENTGHGSGKPLSMQIEQCLDLLVFLANTLELGKSYEKH